MLENYQIFNDVGFKKVGNWQLKPDLIFDLDDASESKTEVLYAFVCDKQILYVGKTDETLKNRMTNYKNGKENSKSGSTNKTIRRNIVECLNRGAQVDIYLLADVQLDYMGHKVSISSGLEPSLIKLLDPKISWNSRYRIVKSDGDILENINKEIIKSFSDNHSLGSLEQFKLGKEYLSKGIFPFNSSSNSKILPLLSGSRVQFKLENDDNIYEGTYTCSGSRRFVANKGILSEWYKTNFELGQFVAFENKDGIWFLSKAI